MSTFHRRSFAQQKERNEYMKKRIRKPGLCFLAVLCLIWLSGCGGVHQELGQESTAPDFTVKLSGGESFTLPDAQGKVVLLNFWATWCSPCVEEMPALEKIYQEYGEQIEVLAVDCGEEKAVVDRFLKEKDYSFPVAYDENNEVSAKYPSDGIPYTLIIGKDGKVTETFTGSMGAEAQYKMYRRALKEAVAQ